MAAEDGPSSLFRQDARTDSSYRRGAEAMDIFKDKMQ